LVGLDKYVINYKKECKQVDDAGIPVKKIL